MARTSASIERCPMGADSAGGGSEPIGGLLKETRSSKYPGIAVVFVTGDVPTLCDDQLPGLASFRSLTCMTSGSRGQKRRVLSFDQVISWNSESSIVQLGMKRGRVASKDKP